MKYALLFLIFEVVFVTAQLCTETNSVQNYKYKANSPNTQNNEWNYQSITSFQQCKQGITSDTKNFDISQVSLLNPKISLDVEDMIQLVMDNASGPLAQYKTDQIKLTSWGATNIARYQSVYFTIGSAEHNFDFWAKAPDAEIQVFFIQDQIYQQCDVEPLYAVLSIPVYGLTETQDIRYAINLNVTTNLDQITDFDFKQNILGAYNSDMTSFVSYKAPLNIPPCGNTNWFVLTQPQLIKQSLLFGLLGLNFEKTLQRTQLDGTNLNFIKGRFIFEGEDNMKDYDDTVEWAAIGLAKDELSMDKQITMLISIEPQNQKPNNFLNDYFCSSLLNYSQILKYIVFQLYFFQYLFCKTYTWVASIIPCLFFALIVCVYGQYELSNIGRFKRPEAKQHEGMEQEALHQDDAVENKLA